VAYYKRAWDEQVASRYRAGEPTPGMSRGDFYGCSTRRNIWPTTSTSPGVDRSLPRRRYIDPNLRVVDLPSRSEHATASTSTRPRRDIDDVVLAVREGSGGRTRPATRHAFLCPDSDRLPYGTVWAGSPSPSCRCRLRGSMGPALPGSVATRSILRHCRNGWRRNFASLGYRRARSGRRFGHHRRTRRHFKANASRAGICSQEV
jgi:hypothetical protein